MPDAPEKPNGAGRAGLVQRLVDETGITEVEASDLIALLGVEWSSLVRQARLLKPKR